MKAYQRTRALLAFQTCADYLQETHEEAIGREGSTMAQHRDEEPKCSYCAAIREVRTGIAAIKAGK